MAEFAKFSQNVRSRASQIENGSTELVKRVAKSSLVNLVRGTRVDTGRARSNWRVGLGSEPRRVIDPYFPGKKLGIQETQNAQAAISTGFARIDSVSPGRGRRLTTAIIIGNNVDYISLLDAKDNFIAPALLKARQQIRNFRFFQRTRDDSDGD